MIEQLKDVLLWARAEQIQIGRIKVGDVELELIDLKLVAPPPPKQEDWTPAQPPADPADLYAELARQRGLNATREDFIDAEERS